MTVRIARRQAAALKPPVRTVGTANPNLSIEGPPGRYRATPQARYGREIARMHYDTPVLQFFERLARIVQECLVDEFDLAHRSIGAEQAGDAIDDQPEIEFAGP